MTQPNTDWIWKDASTDEIWGLSIDLDKKKIFYYDGIGCACGDSFAQQDPADFTEMGPRYGNPPEDVQSEVRESIDALGW